MKKIFATFLLSFALAPPAHARADEAEETAARGVSAELNVLWPFYPGGISEMKVLIPIFGDEHLRGELLLGVYADYAWVVRRESGPTALIAAKTGWRQYFYAGIHAELSFTTGLRHEIEHPAGGGTRDDLISRAWVLAGYQHELSDRFYINARGGAGFLVFRTNHYDEEKKIAPGADLNLGVKF
jgi:hypothetical protein